MGKDTSGADAQVFSDDSPQKWYEEAEDTAGPNDGQDTDPSKETKDESGEDADDDSEGEAGDDDAGEGEDESGEDGDDSDDKEGEEGDRETFNKVLDREKPTPLPETRPRHPKLQDGDYTITDDGEVEIHAKHLIDDYNAVVGDLKTYFKIFDSKGNRDKAEFLAEHMFGFKGDATRSAGRMAYDVFDAFNNAKSKADQEKIVEDYFPELLKDDEAELKAVFREKEPGSKEDEGDGEAEDEVTKDDITKALKLWKSESDIKIDVDKAMDDPEFFEAYEQFQFDPKTGEPLGVEDRVAIAADATFDQADEGKEEAPEINAGGHKKGAATKKAGSSQKKKSPIFTSNVDADPKEWY